MSKWYSGDSFNSDIVLYSKVRLARNLKDYCFPIRMDNEQRRIVSKKVFAAIKSSDFAEDFDIINMAEISDIKAHSYAEKMLISNEFVNNKNNSSFLISKEENVSIMLCEEDHIRLTSFSAGQSIFDAYSKANEIDDVLINSLNIAFDNKLGFLTSSPINLGTGLKTTFVLQLPALKHNNYIFKLSSMISRLGLNLRELYKDGAGDLYSLSNQVTLGISEKSALDNINAICDQIVRQERSAREALKDDCDFEDKIYRTYGMLKMARKLDEIELLNSLSLVRLGVSLGYFDVEYSTIGDMLFNLQNSTLLDKAGADLNEGLRAKLRAQIVREKLE